MARTTLGPALIATVVGLASAGWPSHAAAQSKPTPAELVAQLQSEETADRAANQLRGLARNDHLVREFLSKQLPPLIEAGPKRSLPAWRNAVQLAGDLKMVEAAPALAKWLGIYTGPGASDMHKDAKLENSWPGKALCQIGDPAIPSVEPVLGHGTSRERWTAVYVLSNMGSPRALAVLRNHLPDEPDETLRWFIGRTLELRSGASRPGDEETRPAKKPR